MINIALISFKYPPEYSGYGKQLKSVTEEILKIDKKNYNFRLLTAYDTSKVEETKNFHVISLGSKLFNHPSIVLHIFSIKLFFWLFKNRKKYDIIHCVKAGPEAVSSQFISRLFNKPLIVKVAQDELSQKELNEVSGLRKIRRQNRHRILRNVENFIAISEEINDSLKRFSSKHTLVHHIPNGVDVKEKFYPISSYEKAKMKKRMGFDEEQIIISYVGSINRRKGTYNLLNSISNLETKENIRVLICGPILEDFNFFHKVDSINSHKKNITIDYLGEIDNVPEIMQVSDIFVLPSYSEGLPNVLLEALATGLPLIASNIGGNRDIVNENVNGVLFSAGDEDALTNSISYLVENHVLREKMSTNSREISVSTFNIQMVAKEYMELYRKLMIRKD